MPGGPGQRAQGFAARQLYAASMGILGWPAAGWRSEAAMTMRGYLAEQRRRQAAARATEQQRQQQREAAEARRGGGRRLREIRPDERRLRETRPDELISEPADVPPLPETPPPPPEVEGGR